MNMIKEKINSPLTSSCGRLFDAVSFLVGLSPLEVEFEAEAPMRLEAAASDKIKGSYHFSVLGKTPPLQISFEKTIKGILEDLNRNTALATISSKFHNTLAQIILRISETVRDKHGIDTVAFIGGVFLNKRLMVAATRLLEERKFRILRPIHYSPNDESISVGQIAYALGKLKREKDLN